MYKYVLTPWGNGIDSHRLWETLYAESYPIIPKHYNFSQIFENENFLFKDIYNLSNENLIKNF